MKKLFFSCVFALLFSSICSVTLWAKDLPLPTASNYINDFAGVVSAQDQASISALATELDAKTGAQLAVVTVDTTEPEVIEQYAVRLFKKWGIGQKGQDNGVLFLIAAKDHKLRIEVGYGLEGTLTDTLCSAIINQIVVPQFKQGQISQGVLQGAQAIVSLIAKEKGITITGQETAVYNSLHEDSSSALWVIVFVFIMLFVFFVSSFTRGGRGMGGGYYGGGFGGGSSGSSGGFGGFGGGGSGGGGSSGGW